MKLRPNTILLGLLAASFVLPVYADDDAQSDGDAAFELGQITVQGRRSNVAADERTINTSRRRSFSVTSAARVSRLSLMAWAIAARVSRLSLMAWAIAESVRMEQGATSIPAL